MHISYFSQNFICQIKIKVLQQLDRDSPQPERMARVVTIRGEMPNQEIQDLAVGPLPRHIYHIVWYQLVIAVLLPPDDRRRLWCRHRCPLNQVHTEFEDILFICFGAKLKHCNNQCLTLRIDSFTSIERRK